MKAFVKRQYIQLWALCAIALSFLAPSCDSILGDDLEPCPVEYRIYFKYDRNLKYADAFAHEVNSIALYAFNEDGTLVHERKEEGEALAHEGYSMVVDFNPNDYHLVAWGGLVTSGAFNLPKTTAKGANREELTCRLDRDYEDGTATVCYDLPSLFHGLIQKGAIPPKTNSVTIPLTKNTNTVRVVLQQMSGETLDASSFEFTIRDSNGWLSYANEVLPDEELCYRPWRTESGSTETSRSNLNVILVEFTTGRLVDYKNPILTIKNNDGNTVLSIPLLAYALLVKGYYNASMSDQEYFDRQDEYNLTFLLDQNNQWISSSIIINGWRIVLNESDL